jgi:gamma-glutamyltranspeptidase / glutathione hydrolase
MTTAPQSLRGLVLGSLALATSIITLGTFASGAGAAGSDPYSMQALALLSPSGTDLALTVDGPVLPAVLEKVQVKAWPEGADEAVTRNFFDVAAPGGVASLRLTGLARGDRLEIRAHVKDGPQHNLEANTTVRRRPDLTVTRIDVPADVVRTHAFDVTANIAEVGGDVGAGARVLLFDGASTTALAATDVTVAAGGTIAVSFRIVLPQPGNHTLRAVVTDSAPAEWDVAPNARDQEIYVNHYGENGVVSTDHSLATQIGADVLRAGGNAFDAAAAVQFALNVVQPHLNGIGGGSNIVVRDGKTGEVFAIDARETAPTATTATTYAGLSPDGLTGVRPNGLAVGVPGTMRAVEYLLGRWGTTTLADALGPAIALAEDGFPIGQFLAAQIAVQRGFFQPETRAIFLNPDGSLRLQGEILRQPELAKTFRLLARDGAAAFYEGEIAEAIVAAQHRATTPGREGKMTLADLRAYTIDVERPLSLAYGGYDVYAPAAGGSSGGVVLLESLGLMREFLADPRNEGYAWGFATRNSLHVFIEAMRLAFADRDFWLGDDRYTNVPAAGLVDPEYLRGRSALIGAETVMCNINNTVPPGKPLPHTALPEAEADAEPAVPGHTTHFSIIDRWGNAVVMTSTIRSSFGTGITVPGYGFQLNDSLALFNMPLTPRANPVTGDPGANDAAGGKRAMGNMTPTLILKDGEPFAGTGTLGSAFIPSVMLNVVLNLIEYDLPLQQAIDAPRIWIRFASGAAQLNFGFDHLIAPVRAMGHVSSAFGGCAENLNRTALPPFFNGGPQVGSSGSFGVELESFGLVGGVDSTRFPDASTVVVERN